jgi:hypothetical protein
VNYRRKQFKQSKLASTEPINVSQFDYTESAVKDCETIFQKQIFLNTNMFGWILRVCPFVCPLFTKAMDHKRLMMITKCCWQFKHCGYYIYNDHSASVVANNLVYYISSLPFVCWHLLSIVSRSLLAGYYLCNYSCIVFLFRAITHVVVFNFFNPFLICLFYLQELAILLHPFL